MEHVRDRDFRADYRIADRVVYAPRIWVMNESIQAMEVIEVAHEGAVVEEAGRDYVVIRIDRSGEHVRVQDPEALVKLGAGVLP